MYTSRRKITARKPVARKPYKKRYSVLSQARKTAPGYSTLVDKCQVGLQNSYVPATTSPKFFGNVRYGAAAINLTASTGLVNTYVYSANGLTDPSITGGSLHPAGFDQLITLYEHYTCYKSIATIIFTNNSANLAVVGISLEPDVSFSTDPNNMLELPYSQIVQLEPFGSYGSSKTLKLTANLTKYFGEPVTKTTSIYRGDAVSNPTEQAYYHCKVYGLKGGTADIFMQTKIEYYAVWTEPRELAPSLQTQISKLIIDEHKLKSQPVEIKTPPTGILAGMFGK